jgi:hypothetical protein
MVKRAFKEICRRDAAPIEAAQLKQIQNELVTVDNYNLKRTFEKVATLPACLGE